jgi:hypothetical protein
LLYLIGIQAKEKPHSLFREVGLLVYTIICSPLS